MTARWTIRLVLFLAAGIFMIHACKKNDTGQSAQPTLLSFKIPPGFPQPQYTFTNNPLTEEGFELGRKLFYDGRLSKDGNFPCASCHQQFAAFSTYDHDLSHGFNNQFTKRNAPGIFNMAWQKEFQWDGGVNNIEVQPLAPITAPNEMAENIDNVINKLQQDTGYRRMFKAAFSDEIINSQHMLQAIAQFVASLISADSKYDKVKRGEASFTTAEQTGYVVFQQKCATCHQEPLFTDLSYRNTGIPLNPSIKDVGRMLITSKSEDSLKFKVPSLRNVAVTFPYGHDGRFYAMRSMLDHYSDGVENGPTVDSIVKNKIPLSDADKFYLIQFLYTLTDSTLIKDPRFAQPQ